MAASGLEPLHLRLPHRGEIVDRPTAVSPHCPISDPPARFLPIGRPRLSTPGDASAESPSTPPMRLREKGVRSKSGTRPWSHYPSPPRAVLEGRALDLGPRGPDNLYGRGRLRLGP